MEITAQEFMPQAQETLTILTTDPSGNSTSGYLLFRRWDDWEIGRFTDQKWSNHAKFFHNLVKKEKVQEWAIETAGRFLKLNDFSRKQGGSFMAKGFFDLLNIIGALFYIGEYEGITNKEILNLSVNQLESKALKNEIIGLKKCLVNIKTATYHKKGLMVPRWTFKNKIISEHEKDAVLIFYIYWVIVKKQNWPWTDWD
jgi:hypothetical protein